MRSNLERDGGMVMAEAVMMALAPRAGRLRAHELATLACRTACEERRPLGRGNRHFGARALAHCDDEGKPGTGPGLTLTDARRTS